MSSSMMCGNCGHYLQRRSDCCAEHTTASEAPLINQPEGDTASCLALVFVVVAVAAVVKRVMVIKMVLVTFCWTSHGRCQ